MSRFVKTTITAGVPFGLAMGLFWMYQHGSVFGLVMGLVAGLFFGMALGGFVAWQQSRFTREDPCEPGERLLHQGPANHFRGVESVGGWLYLTNRRLLFRSHNFNLQKFELSIPLKEIREVEPSATLWIIPNGLRVATAKTSARFVVEGRRVWVEKIEQAKG